LNKKNPVEEDWTFQQTKVFREYKAFEKSRHDNTAYFMLRYGQDL